MKLRYAIFTFALLFCAPQLRAQSVAGLTSYPLHAQYKKSAKPLVLYLSGDGGWNDFSEKLVNELVKNGYPVIGLDTRKYFWSPKDPDLFAKDVRKILTAYLKAWNKDRYAIVGYSFGADVGAFLPSRLNGELSAGEPPASLSSLVLLSPGLSTGFVIRLKNMLNFGSTDKEKYKVYPELLKSQVPVWCIFGNEEDSDFDPVLRETSRIHKRTLPGAHRYGDDLGAVSRAIISGL